MHTYSSLSFCQVHLWYDLEMAGLRSWFLLPEGNSWALGCSDLDVVYRPHGRVKSWRYIPFPLETYNTFRVRYFNTFEGLLLQLGVLLYPTNASMTIASSSRTRSDPLSACSSRFLLGEKSKVILEQFEFGALRESTLPRQYFVIYFSEFLPAIGSVRKN